MILIDRSGRRTLLILSGIGMCIFHSITAWSFYSNHKSLNQKYEICGRQPHTEQHNQSTAADNATSFQSCNGEGNHEAAGLSPTLLPLVGIVGFYLMFAIGSGAVPMVILGEVFPHSVKGTAVSCINSSMWVINFGMTKIFFYMNEIFGMHGTFIFFAVSSITMSVYVFLLLPETKQKTLAQIQMEMKGKPLQVNAND